MPAGPQPRRHDIDWLRLPHFFTSLEYFSWHHLWFLIYLFTFTMLYLPLLARLERSDVDVETVRPRVLYVAIVPFAVVQLALRWRWPGYQNLYDDWANFLWYSLFFVGGFLIARFPAVDELIVAERRRCARTFLAAMLGMLPLLAWLDGRITDPGIGYLLYWPLSATAGVCGVAAVLGYGRRLETVGSAWFGYLRESALPVYACRVRSPGARIEPIRFPSREANRGPPVALVRMRRDE